MFPSTRPRYGQLARPRPVTAPAKTQTTPAPLPKPIEPGPGEEWVRAVWRGEVDEASTAVVTHLLPHLKRELGLPEHTRVEWFRPETRAERGARLLDMGHWKVTSAPYGVRGFVETREPCLIWIRTDVPADDLPGLLAHECKHVQQLAGFRTSPRAVPQRIHDHFEREAGAYSRQFGAQW
jgi:hypothetical protein